MPWLQCASIFVHGCPVSDKKSRDGALLGAAEGGTGRGKGIREDESEKRREGKRKR